MRKPVNWIVDMDLAKFFDTLPHEDVLSVLNLRIKDRRFLQLVGRLMKTGVQGETGIVYGEAGSPQGSIVSPVIANVFLDHVLDQWFEEVVKHYCGGYCSLIRYADDALVLFEREEDARRFMRVLPRRLGKYGLNLNAEKTQLLGFGKRHARRCLRSGQKPPTLDFLGLTHYWGYSRKGYVRLKRKTAKKRLRRALKSMNLWLKQVRSVLRLPVIWQIIGQKLRGHFNYYGVSDNSRSLNCYEQEVHALLFKWLNRRSQKRSFNWVSFARYRSKHPLPRPGRLISLYPTS